MRLIPLLFALLLAAFAGWMLLLRTSAPETGRVDDSALDDGPDAGKVLLAAPARPEPTTQEPKAPPRPTSIDPRTVARGGVVVIVEDPSGERISTDLVTASIEGRQFPYIGTPLAARDTEEQVWRFSDVRVGPGRVIVRGDGYFDLAQDVEIVEGTAPELRVRIEPAGGLRWEIRNAAGEPAPGVFTLELLDAEGDAVEAWFQERHERRTTARKRYRRAELGHTGYILGLKAAHYEMRITHPDGRYATEPASVALGETTTVAVTFDD